MAISKRGLYEAPRKSPYSFERYDSELERMFMVKLERDAEVVKWQKRHGISIPWIDGQGRKCNYRPDFLVEYNDGRKEIIEVKNPALMDSVAINRKRKAAEEWCRRRGMAYKMATI
ncbi:MAG: TnsA endonuclease N-terminal domain-containing protein [Chloroflexota bacterium]|nr:TnsA endonuclease N-terminal domain-containing protein [Chloroflexota bacterium]MDE2970375.1 TnsA endonuclease N-terminal domain-containing protein [Chloroflexota bacterium]